MISQCSWSLQRHTAPRCNLSERIALRSGGPATRAVAERDECSARRDVPPRSPRGGSRGSARLTATAAYVFIQSQLLVVECGGTLNVNSTFTPRHYRLSVTISCDVFTLINCYSVFSRNHCLIIFKSIILFMIACQGVESFWQLWTQILVNFTVAQFCKNKYLRCFQSFPDSNASFHLKLVFDFLFQKN